MLVAWLLFGIALSSPAAAQPQTGASAQQAEPPEADALPALEHTSNESAYQRVKTLAVQEWDAGHSAEARALFLIAHTLKPSARTLRALGMTAYELRAYPEAVRELSAALSDQRDPLDRKLRKEAQSLLAQAEAFVARYRILLAPADARLRVDGARLEPEPDGTLLLAVGPHQLEIEANGFRGQRHALMVANSDGGELSFRLSPEGEPAAQKPAASSLPAPLIDPSPPRAPGPRDYVFTWSSAGAALALGATSFALHKRAQLEDERLEDACDGGCDPRAEPIDELTHKRDNLERWSFITLGGAALFAGASIALYFVERKQRRQRLARPSGGARTRVQAVFGLSDLTLQF